MTRNAIVEGIRLTHADRILYPEQNLSKRDLASYYAAVASWILPHVTHRPLSLVRCPAGVDGACFYQKHFREGLPEGVQGVIIAETRTRQTYAVIEDLRGLIGLVQIGALELHPWGATVERLEQPDRLVIDLDPGPGLPWAWVTEAALSLRDILARLDLDSFAKTTGGKGLHVVVPLQPHRDWATLKAVARGIAARLTKAAPDRYTVTLSKNARKGRIFLDYLRNSRGQTAVAPYSPRARAGAPVAVPIAWSEVDAGVSASSFTIATVPGRLASLTHDPWAGMAGIRQTLTDRLLRELDV